MDGKFFQKIFQKSSKDSLKSSQNRCLGVVLGGLGASWGGLGASWGVLGGGLGGFWLPGASWEASGAARGRFWWPRWPNLGPKMASSWGLDRTKIDANIARIFDAFENRNLDGKS